jgi:hypothetical protein
MNVERDFREFFALLNRHDVRYLIIGGFAFSYYAEPRYTKDIDILIELSEENARNLMKALNSFGFSDLKLNAKDFLESEQIIQLGVAPVRIDILTSIRDIEFPDLWDDRVTDRYGDVDVWFISKKDLIRIKRLSGRQQDLADIEKLEKI